LKGFLPLSLIACVPAVIFLGQPADLDIYNYMKNKGEVDAPFYVKFLGEGTSVLSYMSVLQADLYYHGGAGHFFEEHAEHPALKGGGDAGPHEYGDNCGHEAHGAETRHAGNPGWNFILKISRDIAVTEHTHLSDDKVQEMLPWLYYAAKLDPHNVEAYTIGAYWLADRLRKKDEAVVFLKEGLKNNPDNWEISAEIGRIYFQYYKRYRIAGIFLAKAYGALIRTEHDKFQERYVLSFWAYSAEAAGDKAVALKAFRRIKELFPGSAGHDEKIRELTLE
jgi:tetratricopeptide (TPR) repeat protein